MRWLVTGGRGQLGVELHRVLSAAGAEVHAPGRAQLDITDAAAVDAAVAGADVVVNAAAYTAVDAAETDQASATRVNGEAAGLLAAAAARHGARIVQVSTDYVLGGDATVPYPESAPRAPRNAYGRSKALGEQLVLAAAPDHALVVRTAWLYGAGGPNFVRTMLRLAGERETVQVVDDQIGQPTWARDLAHGILRLVEAEAPAGIYHGTNSGQASWFELARAVFENAGHDPARVEPTTSAGYPRPAARPAWSVLGHDAWERVGVPPLRPWRAALDEAMAEGLVTVGETTEVRG